MTAQPFAGADNRQHWRFDIGLGVTADIAGATVSAQLVNLSLSGLLLSFPLPTSAYAVDRISQVSIPEVGTLPVSLVWSSGHRAGLRFLDSSRAKLLIGKFLDDGGFDPA